MGRYLRFVKQRNQVEVSRHNLGNPMVLGESSRVHRSSLHRIQARSPGQY
jgi:hypothetical protein